jgi:hypothetical protein
VTVSLLLALDADCVTVAVVVIAGGETVTVLAGPAGAETVTVLAGAAAVTVVGWGTAWVTVTGAAGSGTTDEVASTEDWVVGSVTTVAKVTVVVGSSLVAGACGDWTGATGVVGWGLGWGALERVKPTVVWLANGGGGVSEDGAGGAVLGDILEERRLLAVSFFAHPTETPSTLVIGSA